MSISADIEQLPRCQGKPKRVASAGHLEKKDLRQQVNKSDFCETGMPMQATESFLPKALEICPGRKVVVTGRKRTLLALLARTFAPFLTKECYY
jgi:hypothetical protein